MQRVVVVSRANPMRMRGRAEVVVVAADSGVARIRPCRCLQLHPLDRNWGTAHANLRGAIAIAAAPDYGQMGRANIAKIAVNDLLD